jgi:hypothetical protein
MCTLNFHYSIKVYCFKIDVTQQAVEMKYRAVLN